VVGLSQPQTKEIIEQLSVLDKCPKSMKLSALYQDEFQIPHFKRRKEIYEILHPETVNGGDRKSDNFRLQILQTESPSFAEDTAAKTRSPRRRCPLSSCRWSQRGQKSGKKEDRVGFCLRKYYLKQKDKPAKSWPRLPGCPMIPS